MIYEKATDAANFIKSQYKPTHRQKQLEVALVLGSGLGAFANEIENRIAIPYEAIPNFVRSTVEGHAGQLILGEISGIPVIVQQGRFHYYEGYSLEEVTFPMRVFGLLGVKTVVLTNAAGSINTDFKPGTLMVITDHINLIGTNPLRGRNDERFGPRFPDMTEVYSLELQDMMMEEARAINTILRRGVYCALSGPSYETPAEIRMLRSLGADVVGMSTVPEAIVARHQNMKVAAVSCVSNLAAGIGEEKINHEEVMEAGVKVAQLFKELLKRVVTRIV